MTTVTSTLKGPYYGAYGGAFVPETLVPAVRELEAAYDEAAADSAFREIPVIMGREIPCRDLII